MADALTAALGLGRLGTAVLTASRFVPVLGAAVTAGTIVYGGYQWFQNRNNPRTPETSTPVTPTTPVAPTVSNPRNGIGAKVGEGRYTPPTAVATPEQIQQKLAEKASEAVGGANPSAGAGADSGASSAADLLQALKVIGKNGGAASASLALISGALLKLPDIATAIRESAPTITIPDISIPEIKIPEIDFAPVAAAIKAIQFPEISLPDISVNVPPIAMPELPALDLSPVGDAIAELANAFPAKDLLDSLNEAKKEALDWAKSPVSVHALDGEAPARVIPREAAVAKDVSMEITARETNNEKYEDDDFDLIDLVMPMLTFKGVSAEMDAIHGLFNTGLSTNPFNLDFDIFGGYSDSREVL